MIYRVVIKVGYNEAWFDFKNSVSAAEFATKALANMTQSPDQKKVTYITIKVMEEKVATQTTEEEEEEDDE